MGSFCDTNFYTDGPQTYAEAGNTGRQMCPNFQRCNSGDLNSITGLQSTMMFGIQVAQESLKTGKTIAQEMETSDVPDSTLKKVGLFRTIVRNSKLFQTTKKFLLVSNGLLILLSMTVTRPNTETLVWLLATTMQALFAMPHLGRSN